MFEVEGSSPKAGLEAGGKRIKNLPEVKRSLSEALNHMVQGEAILNPKAKRS